MFIADTADQKYQVIDHKEGIKNILTMVAPIKKTRIDGKLVVILFTNNLMILLIL